MEEPVDTTRFWNRDERTKSRSGTRSWKDHIRFELRSLYQAITHVTAKTKRDETDGRSPCTRCTKMSFQISQFDCHPDAMRARDDDRPAADPIHRYCPECIAKVIVEQSAERRRVFQGQRQQSSGLLSKIDEKLRVQFVLPTGYIRPDPNIPFLVLCPKCRSPNVLVRESRFQCALDAETKAKSLTDEFVVNLDASRILADHFMIEKCWENQRRPPFGVFSADNLLVIDFHGRFCLENSHGSAIDCAVSSADLQEAFQLPNSKWMWMEQWNPAPLEAQGGDFVAQRSAGVDDSSARGEIDDTVDGDGWIYPGKFFQYPCRAVKTKPDMTSFVRQRRLIRTRMRFSDEIIEQVNACFDPNSSERN